MPDRVTAREPDLSNGSGSEKGRRTAEDPSRRAYAASATAMDDQIGRVMNALAEKKMLDNTLIVFQSDNGGTRNPMFAGAITDMTKIVPPADNGPYRDGKGTLYEGGTRVVALASWPGCQGRQHRE